MLSKYTQQYFCSLYKTLGVNQHDSIEQIKEAYLKLAKQHHPDVQNSDSSTDFKLISNAYNTLKDPFLRRQYDNKFKYKTIEDHHKEQPKYHHYSYYDSNKAESQYSYQTEKTKGQYQLTIIMISGAVLVSLWITYNSVETMPEDGYSYEQLQNAYNEQQQQNSAMRRQNMIMANENINDSPQNINKRKQQMEQEMKQKQFRIEMEEYQHVVKGQSKVLKRKTNDREVQRSKTTSGDLTLSGYAKQHNIVLYKSVEPVYAKEITIHHVEQNYM